MFQQNSIGKVTDKSLGFPDLDMMWQSRNSYKRQNKADCKRGSHFKREKFAGEPTWRRVMSSLFSAHEIMRTIRAQERDWQSLSTHEPLQPPQKKSLSAVLAGEDWAMLSGPWRALGGKD